MTRMEVGFGPAYIPTVIINPFQLSPKLGEEVAHMELGWGEPMHSICSPEYRTLI